MVDDFEKVALDCLSNSHIRRAGLVVIDEVNAPFLCWYFIYITIPVFTFDCTDWPTLEVHRKVQWSFAENLQRLGGRGKAGEVSLLKLVFIIFIKIGASCGDNANQEWFWANASGASWNVWCWGKQEILHPVSSLISSIRWCYQVIELTVRNWDEVYEDLSKRLKVKPQGGAVGSKHLKMAGQASVCWFKFTLGVRNAVKDGISHQGGSRRKGQGHLPGATKLIPAAIYPIHKQTQKFVILGGRTKGGEDKRGDAEKRALNQGRGSALLISFRVLKYIIVIQNYCSFRNSMVWGWEMAVPGSAPPKRKEIYKWGETCTIF